MRSAAAMLMFVLAACGADRRARSDEEPVRGAHPEEGASEVTDHQGRGPEPPLQDDTIPSQPGDPASCSATVEDSPPALPVDVEGIAGPSSVEGSASIVIIMPDAGGAPVRLRLLDAAIPPNARVRVRAGAAAGWHATRDVVVESPPGRVVLASLANGDVSLVPGWTAELGPVAEERRTNASIERSHWLVVARDGKRAYVRRGRDARRLATSDGTFVVRGSAIRHAGERPPEASDYESFFLCRARE